MQKEELQSRILRVLSELASHTGRGGIYYPMDASERLLVDSRACRFCAGCLEDARAGGFCRNTVCTSAVQAYAVGDAWFFRCWLGLESLVVPIAPVSAGEIIGSIEVGGFIDPGQANTARETALSRLSSVDALDLFQILFTPLQQIAESDPNEKKAVAEFLLEATFAEGLNSASFFNTRRRIREQQQRLAAKVQELQPSYPQLPDALISLGEMIRLLRQRDLHQSRLKLDDFLGNMLLNSGDSLESAKAYFFILLSSLACDRSLSAGSWYPSAQRFEEQLLDLNRMQDMESLCYWAEKLVLNHHQALIRPEKTDKNEGRISDRALDYIRRNYMQNLSLLEAARSVGASPSSLVHGLKAETGRTFIQHLTAIRISEAKRMLAYSNYSLGEISRMCGFKDQSYFTKVFRREINLTPREFRNILVQRMNPVGGETNSRDQVLPPREP